MKFCFLHCISLHLQPWFLSLALVIPTPAKQAKLRSFSSSQSSNEVKKSKKQSLEINSFAKHYESGFGKIKIEKLHG